MLSGTWVAYEIQMDSHEPLPEFARAIWKASFLWAKIAPSVTPHPPFFLFFLSPARPPSFRAGVHFFVLSSFLFLFLFLFS